MFQGYFTYDMLTMAWYGLLDRDMCIHHIGGVVGTSIAVFSGVNLYTLIWGAAIGELSNPCLHLRTMFKHLGWRYARCYEVTELAFFFLFVFARLVLGQYFYYLDGLTCEHFCLAGKLLLAGIML